MSAGNRTAGALGLSSAASIAVGIYNIAACDPKSDPEGYQVLTGMVGVINGIVGGAMAIGHLLYETFNLDHPCPPELCCTPPEEVPGRVYGTLP